MKNIINEKQYVEVFKKQAGCTDTEISNIRVDDNSLILNYKNNEFHVASDLDILYHYKKVLTTDLASYIPVDIWIYINEGIFYEPKFHNKLMKKLNNKELENYKAALDKSKMANNDDKVFWHFLYNFGIEKTCSKAINATT